MREELINKLKLCFDKSPQEVVDYLKSQGIKLSSNWKEQLEIVRRHCFTVSKVFAADVLQTILDALVEAIENGTSFKDFKENLHQTLAEKGFSHVKGTRWRIDTIYRTNLQSSYMAGRYYNMVALQEEFPYWQYIAVMDVRTRPHHAAIHGKVVRANDPFWQKAYPPNGYNCRCRVRALSEEEVKMRRLRVSVGNKIDFTPDEGFESNPAAEWKPNLNKFAPSIRKKLNEALARQQ